MNETEQYDMTLMHEQLIMMLRAAGFTVDENDYGTMLEIIGTALEQVNWDTVRATLRERDTGLRCPYCGSDRIKERDDALSLYRVYKCETCEELFDDDDTYK